MENSTSFPILFLDNPMLLRKIYRGLQRQNIIILRFDKIPFFGWSRTDFFLNGWNISFKR